MRDKTIISIQWLRGIAAMMIVVHHARNPAPWLFNPLDKYFGFLFGVDIFFVISGFIMFVAARNEGFFDFIKRRLIRVAPLYWLATLSFLLVVYKSHVFHMEHAELIHLIKSLCFIPHYSTSSPDKIWPFLIPGWSLNYEMFFYLVFSLALLSRRPVQIIAVTLILLVGIGWLNPNSRNPIFKTYTDPLLLEFLSGILLGNLWAGGKITRSHVFFLPIGVIGLFSLPFLWDPKLMMGCRILFSTMILAGTVSANSMVSSILLLDRLGNASYSIYLSHGVFGLPLSAAIVSTIPVEGGLQFALWIAISLIACGSIGYAIHVAIEKPLFKFLRKLLLRQILST